MRTPRFGAPAGRPDKEHQRGAPALDIAQARSDKPRQQGTPFMSAADLAKTPTDARRDHRRGVRASATRSARPTKGAVREAVEEALDLLDRGAARVAEKAADGSWRVNQWLKKAVLLSFRLNDMSDHSGRPRPRRVVGQGPVEIRQLGRQAVSAPPASAPCRAAWCAAPPTSRRAWC